MRHFGTYGPVKKKDNYEAGLTLLLGIMVGSTSLRRKSGETKGHIRQESSNSLHISNLKARWKDTLWFSTIVKLQNHALKPILLMDTPSCSYIIPVLQEAPSVAADTV